MTKPKELNHIAQPLRGLAVRTDTLTLDPNNARTHGQKNKEAVRKSLDRFGFLEPLVVQKQGMVVRAGNCRLEIARENGWDYVPAVVVDQADAEATAFAIADNRTAELASWDVDTLRTSLEGLLAFSPDLYEVASYTLADLDALATDVPNDATDGGTDFDVANALDAQGREHTCPSCNYTWRDGRGE